MPIKKTRGDKKNIWWLSATSFLTDISSEMILPILPFFLKNVLGASFILIGFIEGLANGLASFLEYFSGFLSDKTKKRKGLTVLGYSLSALSKLFFALARNPLIVLAFRSLDRIGKGVRTAPRDALISQSVAAGERGRYFGFHRAADTAGAVIGTVIAILVLYFMGNNIADTIRLILFISFGFAVLGALLLLGVKEIQPSVVPVRTQRLFDFGKLSKRFKIFLLVAALYGLANYSYAFYILRAENIGLSLFLIPVAYLLYNILYAVSSYPAGWLSDKISRRRLLLTAFVLFIFINLGFAFLADTTTIWFLFAFYGLFIGLTDGVFRAFVADLAVKEEEGEAFGLYHMIIGITTLTGNLLGGIIWQTYGATWPFVLSAFLILLAAVVLTNFHRRWLEKML